MDVLVKLGEYVNAISDVFGYLPLVGCVGFIGVGMIGGLFGPDTTGHAAAGNT